MNKALTTLALVAALGLAVTGCSGDDKKTAAKDDLSIPADLDKELANFSGAAGLVTARDGDTITVKENEDERTVDLSQKPKVLVTKTLAVTEVKAGQCVMATLGEKGKAAHVVAISDPVKGNCDDGFGGGDTPPPTREKPAEGTTKNESGEGDDAAMGPAVAIGTVAKVADNTITVTLADKKDGATHAVLVDDKTQITTETAGSVADIKKDLCVYVQGSGKDKKVTAEEVSVSPAKDGQC